MHIDRRFRLPSYRAMVEQQDAEENKRKLLCWQNTARKSGIELHSVDADIAAFNGKVDSHITEADCRGKLVPGDEYIRAYMTRTLTDVSKPVSTLVREQQAQRQADADDWIQHDGNGMPVTPWTVVAVRQRNGRVTEKVRAILGGLLWRDDGCASDIVAYRVLG